MTTSLQRFYEISSKGAPDPQAPSFIPSGLWLCADCRQMVHSRGHDCDRYFANRTMPTEPTPVPVPQPSLRKAASEALLAGALALSDVSRATKSCDNGWTDAMKASEERFRKALEQLAEALA